MEIWQVIATVLGAVFSSAIVQEAFRRYINWRGEKAQLELQRQLTDRQALDQAQATRQEDMQTRILSLESQINALSTQLSETLGKYFQAALDATKCSAQIDYMKQQIASLQERLGERDAELSRADYESKVPLGTSGGAGSRSESASSRPS